jgi:hypothetical protein
LYLYDLPKPGIVGKIFSVVCFLRREIRII